MNSITIQDVADQLVARIRVQTDNLEAMPDTPPLAEQRKYLRGRIDGLSQALAMVRRIS